MKINNIKNLYGLLREPRKISTLPWMQSHKETFKVFAYFRNLHIFLTFTDVKVFKNVIALAFQPC